MSTLYDIGRSSFLTNVTQGTTPFSGQTNWGTDTFGVVLLDLLQYTAVPATDVSLANVLPGARVATTPLVNPVALADGTASADNTVFTAVVGAEVGAVLIYRDNLTAEEDDNVLIAYIDSAISGLPVTPNGGDITILWNGGDGRIFRL